MLQKTHVNLELEACPHAPDLIDFPMARSCPVASLIRVDFPVPDWPTTMITFVPRRLFTR